jgi:hypothetical protein
LGVFTDVWMFWQVLACIRMLAAYGLHTLQRRLLYPLLWTDVVY